ncbi:MAG: ATP-binding protein [Phyllobacterium sp.]|uniref:sensor histidine kinase n=1 Tax=Phyllobacterium sp. TaxID=1871046 RepID=UPI0030EFF175
MSSLGMTGRLIFSLTLALIGFWLVAVAAGVYVMQDEFGEIFDSSLKETTERLASLVVDDLLQNEGDLAPRRLQNVTRSRDESYLTYQVRDATGTVVLHSEDISPRPFSAPLEQGFWEDDYTRFYTVAALEGSIFVQVADLKAHRNEAAIEGGTALLLPLLILIPLSIFVVRFVIRRSLAPVNALGKAIASKDSGNLAPLAPIALPRELQPIAHSVNRLLGRLRSALAAEREFTANSAHELRTPLAGALAQTQLLKMEVRGRETKFRALQIETALQKLNGLVEKLMQLARAEADLGQTSELVDLAHVLDLIVDEFQRASHDGARIEYIREEGAELRRFISEDIFAIALRNLIENALKHGSQDEAVSIHLDAQGTISVANGGPVLTPDEIELNQRRFARGTTSASGAGLGLSIVLALARQMNATLNFRSPATNRNDGFEAILHFSEALSPA